MKNLKYILLAGALFSSVESNAVVTSKHVSRIGPKVDSLGLRMNAVERASVIEHFRKNLSGASQIKDITATQTTAALNAYRAAHPAPAARRAPPPPPPRNPSAASAAAGAPAPGSSAGAAAASGTAAAGAPAPSTTPRSGRGAGAAASGAGAPVTPPPPSYDETIRRKAATKIQAIARGRQARAAAKEKVQANVSVKSSDITNLKNGTGVYTDTNGWGFHLLAKVTGFNEGTGQLTFKVMSYYKPPLDEQMKTVIPGKEYVMTSYSTVKDSMGHDVKKGYEFILSRDAFDPTKSGDNYKPYKEGDGDSAKYNFRVVTKDSGIPEIAIPAAAETVTWDQVKGIKRKQGRRSIATTAEVNGHTYKYVITVLEEGGVLKYEITKSTRDQRKGSFDFTDEQIKTIVEDLGRPLQTGDRLALTVAYPERGNKIRPDFTKTWALVV